MSIELRKKPKQARSLERFNTILNHAEQMIQSVGVSNFKISDLARRAEVNIATIYQYFPNQASLLRHLMESKVTEFIQYVTEPDIPSNLQLECVVDVVVERCQEFLLSNPVFFQLRGVSQADEQLQALSIQDTHTIIDAFSPSLNEGLRADSINPETHKVLFVMMETCMHLLQISSALQGDERKSLVEKTKTMIVSYLETLKRI